MAGNTRSAFIEELKAMKDRMEELFLCNFDTERKQSPGQETRCDDWLPLTDIVDTGKELIYTLDLPGVRDSDLEVECKADRLYVSGAKSDSVEAGEPLRTERPQGTFSRIFKFPYPIDESRIQAEFKRGVLRIVVPRLDVSNDRGQRIFVRQEE